MLGWRNLRRKDAVGRSSRLARMDNATLVRVVAVPAGIFLAGMGAQALLAPDQPAWGFFEMAGIITAALWFAGEFAAYHWTRRDRT